MESLNYVNKHLQRELTAEQIVRIARIVALPGDNEVVRWLLQHYQGEPRKAGLSLADRFDRAFVVWPAQAIPQRRNARQRVDSKNLVSQKRMATETR
jgi:hypothetical protein